MEERRRYLMWLCFVTECNPRLYAACLSAFSNEPKALFDAAARGKLPDGLSEKRAAVLKSKAGEAYIDRCLEYLKKNRISAALAEDGDYPALLKQIIDPPPVLFYKGRLCEMRLPIAVIGSRRHTEYGRRVAERLSGELAERGVCIVSGLAHGIDCIAAEAALEARLNDYPTVAVLGCGVDVIYPRQNAALYARIIERGAVISEFLPGTRPEKYNFPRRNRVISGLSRGVAVVEASAESGTSITVDHALEQGRDVFAVPGRITDRSSEGTNLLIAQGCAKCVLSASDILEEYGVRDAASRPAEIDESKLTVEQTLIVRLLMADERSFDELCELTGLPAAELNSVLTQLEFSGIIKQSPGRLFRI